MLAWGCVGLFFRNHPFVFVFPSFHYEREDQPKASDEHASPTNERKRREEFEHGFVKLPSEQPPITDIISLNPGVACQANGRRKQGPKSEENQMTLQSYQRYVSGS